MLNDMAEHKPILKNKPKYVPPLFWFRTQHRYSIPQYRGFDFTVNGDHLVRFHQNILTIIAAVGSLRTKRLKIKSLYFKE